MFFLCSKSEGACERLFIVRCSTVAAASLLPKMVDLENCLQEERLSSEKLSKLFEAPSVTLSSPVLKKSHSDGIVKLCGSWLLWIHVV